MKPKLAQRIRNRDIVIGTFYKFNSSPATEIIGLAGFDFIVVDCEHANIGYESVERIISTAKNVSLSTIIRVPSINEEHILHSLDSGADGVQIPNITDIKSLESSIKSAKYYPLGTRGLSRNQSAAKYGMWDKEQPYTEYANENTVVVVHIENVEMVEEIERICQYPQIDVVFVGPADLSQSLGIPGKRNDPKVLKLTEKVFKAAVKHNKIAGTIAGNEKDMEKYINMGATYMLYSSDVTIFAKAAKSAYEKLEKLKK